VPDADDVLLVVQADAGRDNEEDIIRVGHMGYNAQRDRVARTMEAIEAVVRDLR
jgi:aspartate aminotransferase-like enzyme